MPTNRTYGATLADFKVVSTFSGQGGGRLIYDVSTQKPVETAFYNKGQKAKILKMGEFYSQNAHIVDAFENAIIKAFDAGKVQKANAEAALSTLSLHHQGATPLIQRDVANIFLILNADEQTLKKYNILQALASAISKDFRFIEFIKNAFPGKKRRLGLSDTYISLGKTALGITLPPVALIKKCYDLCTTSDRQLACSKIVEVAEILKSPFAHYIANTLSEDYWSQEINQGFDIALTVIGASLAPTLVSVPLIGSIGVTAANLTLVEKALKSVGQQVVQYKISELNEPDLGRTPLPLPVFPVRRDQGGTDETKPEAGRDELYRMGDAKVLTALICYLSMPSSKDFLRGRLAASSGLKKYYYFEEARLVFKNLLGSANSEDCARDFGRGMTQQEYIFERFGNRDLFKYNVSASRWTGVKNRQTPSSTLRPPSFLRLLAVAVGVADNHGEGSYYRDGASFNSVMAASFKPTPDSPMWEDDWEKNFDNIGKHHPALDYLASPWIAYAPKPFKDIERVTNYRFSGISPMPLEQFLVYFDNKMRWKGDYETLECGVCNSGLWKGFRHHCRYCGVHTCKTHSNTKKMIGKDSNSTESVYVCSACVEKKLILRDKYAMREGDVRWLLPDKVRLAQRQGRSLFGR